MNEHIFKTFDIVFQSCKELIKILDPFALFSLISEII